MKFDNIQVRLPGNRVVINDIKSLEKISKYPDDLIVYPGHGPKTKLGVEKNNFKYYY